LPQQVARSGAQVPAAQQVGLEAGQQAPLPHCTWVEGQFAAPVGQEGTSTAQPPPLQQAGVSAAQLVPPGQHTAPGARHWSPQQEVLQGSPPQHLLPESTHLPLQQ